MVYLNHSVGLFVVGTYSLDAFLCYLDMLN